MGEISMTLNKEFCRQQGEVHSRVRKSVVFLEFYHQLDEAGACVYSKRVGRTRVYPFDPRYPFLQDLKALLEKALIFYPEEMKELLLMNRRRPRRSGKPL